MASPDTQFGKYELIDRIAAGGMAEIFRARFSPAPGVVKPVVIKKILPHYAANKGFIAMFTNEARIVMGLSHGNIAQVFDFGQVEGDWYLAMELVDGQPLSKVVKRMRATGILTVPPELAAYATAEMLKGLHYAHTRLDDEGRPLQIVHRDVSPQNVLVSYEGQIKLVDFGIARARNARSEDTASNAVKGKYAYFAPEQARGKSLDARTDVCAAGIVLYELLTGQLPFQGRMMEVLTKIVRGQFELPSALNPGIPKALEAIVLKAMALEPNDRYASAEAFQQDLTRYLAVNHPDFTPSELTHFLGLLFESELVKNGRPVQIPREFAEKAQRWQRGVPVPEPEPEAPPPPGEDPEEAIPTELVEIEVARAVSDPQVPRGPSVDEEEPTRPIPVPVAPSRPRAPSWVRALVLGVAAVLVGFGAVSLALRLSRGTLEITSEPSGAIVRLNGRTIDQRTPVELRELAGGRSYFVEVVLEGHRSWANDVPLRRGQHLVVNAKLEGPPTPVAPKPLPAPTPPPTPVAIAPVSREVISWPTSSFVLEAAKHRVDLSAAAALSLPLDEKQTYRVTLSKGPSLGWGYYVVNSSGAAPGPLPTTPQQIKGASRLFVFRLPVASLAGSPQTPDLRGRTLIVDGKGRPRTHRAPANLDVPPSARVTMTGLDARTAYEVIVTSAPDRPAHLRPGTAAISRCVVGHPTLGLLVAEIGRPLRVTGATELFFTLLDDASDDQDGALIIELKPAKPGLR